MNDTAGFLRATIAKDLRRRLRDVPALLIWTGIPVALGVLLSLVAGGGDGATPTARVLLVDQDDSALSNLLSGAATQAGGLMSLEEVDLEEGRARIDAGEASALLIVPAGFQQAVLEETAIELTLVTNPAQRILPGIVEEVLEVMIEGSFYLQRLFGEPLRQIAEGPGSDETFDSATVAAIAADINDRITGLETSLFPPVLTVEFTTDSAEDQDEEPGFDFGQLFLPGLLFMSILFIAEGAAADIWTEREAGTLRRVVTAPQSLATFLAGKLAAGAVLVAGITVVAISVAILGFGLELGRVPAALSWCVYSGTALLCFFQLLQTFASSQRTAGVLSTMVLFPLIMIGGSFFPFEAMPGWMQAIGSWTPNGLAVVQLKALLFGTPEIASIAAAAAGIGLPAALAFVLSARRMSGRFVTES